MKQLRLPCLSGGTPFITLPHPTLVDFLFSLVAVKKSRQRRRGVGLPVSPSFFFPVFVPRTRSVLPSSLPTLRAYALFSDPGWTSAPCLDGVLGFAPLYVDQEDSSDLFFRGSIARPVH